MTQDEKDAEALALLKERAQLRETEQCLTSKIKKACSAYQFMNLVETSNSPLVEQPDGTFALPTSVRTGGDYALPRTEDLANWIQERINARSRLEEIDGLLPAWAKP